MTQAAVVRFGSFAYKAAAVDSWKTRPLATVAADPKQVYIGEDDALTAIDLQTGLQNWRLASSGIFKTVVTADHVFITEKGGLDTGASTYPDDLIKAVDKSDGRALFAFLPDGAITSLAAAPDAVFFATRYGRLYRLGNF